MNEVARLQPAQGFSETLMRVLSDPNIPADKLQVVLQMQRELLEDRRKESFQAAFRAMAVKLPQINRHGLVELKKDGRVLGSYKYAKWEDMDEVIRPILHEHGFALTFSEIPKDGGRVHMQGVLMHDDGGSRMSETSLPPDTGPGRNNLQAVGSAKTYAKRYLAEDLLNLVRKGVDDDGRGAVPKPISAAQVKELSGLLKAIKTQPETFLRLFVTGVEKMEDIQERDYPRLVNALTEKKQSMEKDK